MTSSTNTGIDYIKRSVNARPGWSVRQFGIETLQSELVAFQNPPPKTLHYIFLPDPKSLNKMCQLVHHCDHPSLKDAPVYRFITPGRLLMTTSRLDTRLLNLLGMSGDQQCFVCSDRITFDDGQKFKPAAQCLHCDRYICSTCIEDQISKYNISYMQQVVRTRAQIQYDPRCASCGREQASPIYLAGRQMVAEMIEKMFGWKI